MTYIYTGVSPSGNSSAGVETGVYVRLGTHVPGGVDEFNQLPSRFVSDTGATDASATEGILITSCGTYVLAAAGTGDIQYEGGLKQNVTGGMKTSVNDGDCATRLAQGAIAITGKKGFEVKAETGDLTIEATEGKVSVSADYIYKHTFGSYLKRTDGKLTKGVQGESTNVSLALVGCFYASAVLSASLASLSLKVFSYSVKIVKVSTGLFSFSCLKQSHSYIGSETAYSWMYIKTRKVQLQSTKANIKPSEILGYHSGLVSLSQAIAHAGSSGIRGVRGLQTTIPGI